MGGPGRLGARKEGARLVHDVGCENNNPMLNMLLLPAATPEDALLFEPGTHHLIAPPHRHRLQI